MKKRLFAMLLALALVVSLLPVSALAAKDWNFVIQPVVYDNGSKVDDYTFTSKNYSGTTTGQGDSGDAVWDWSPSGNNYALHSSNDYPRNAPVRYVSPEELWEYDSDELEFKGVGFGPQATTPTFGAGKVYNNEQDTLTSDAFVKSLIYLFEVKEEPEPVVPEGPDLATIKRSNVQIRIKCDNPDDHRFGYTLTKTLVEGSYTLGEVVSAGDGAYTCDVIINGEYWVNYYKTYQDKNDFTHSAIEGQDMNPVVKLEWTEEAGWHKSANYEIPVINVHHEAEEEPEPEERVSTYKVEVVNGHITYKTGLTGNEALNAKEVAVESGTTLKLSADLYVYFTFYSDGGLHEETLVNGELKNPQTDGYERKLNYQPNPSAVWNEEIKVTFAEPEPETYTVSYEWGGVWKPYDLLNKLPADAEYEPGDEVRVTTDYFLGQTYDNGSSQFYKFLGWTYSPEVEIDRGEFIMPEEDVVITGKWLRDQNPASVYHTVNIEVINCTATCGTETITSTASIKVADGAMPIIVFKGDEGYELGGITVGGSRVTSLELDDGSRVYYFKEAVTGDKNVVITYEDPNMPEPPETKWITRNAKLEILCVNGNVEHEKNPRTFALDQPERYEISEVTGNPADGYTCTITVDGTKYLTAFNNGLKIEHTLLDGETLNPVVTFRWDNAEDGWYIDGGNAVIKVVCEEPGFSITYEPGCEDEVTGMPEDTTAAAGAELTLTDTPARDGYIFDGWTSEQVELDENGGFTMPEEDVTFTAQWVKKSAYDPDEILANKKYIEVEVYVDGQLVSGDNPVLNYIDLASPNETAEFNDGKDRYNYDFEYYNCLSIGVTAKPGYVVEAIDSYLMYGQDGTDGIFDTADSDEAEYGEYFIDNVRYSGQTVKVYLRTPYSVKFFGTDGEVIAQYTASGLVAGATDTVPSGNPEDAASSVGETGHYHVPCDCASTAVCPHIGWVDRYFGQRTEHIVFVAEKADSVEMPVLPEGADGWYLNDEAFTGDTYEVDAADATDGVISFYAKADEAEAASLTVKHEYTLITREYQDGVYVETGSESVTETAGTIEGLTAGEYTIPEEYKTALEGYEDYAYSDDNPASVTLVAGENEVTLKFVDYAYPATYTVEYRLYTYVGGELVKTEYPEPFTGTGMRGEQITIEVPEFEGFEFDADKSSSLTQTLAVGSNEYHLNYYKYITEPSYDDLAAIFKSQIYVNCDNPDVHTIAGSAFSLYENTGDVTYYSVAEGEDGAYTVTIYAEPYIARFDALPFMNGEYEHRLIDPASSEISVTVKYDAETGAWAAEDELPIHFYVTCNNTVKITPADIVAYVGGESYSGVTNAAGEIISTATGLPEPGYHIELPAWVNALLEENGIEDGADLAGILEFSYDGVDSEGNQVTRTWTLVDQGVYSSNPYRYVYSLETENGPAVRIQYTGPDGQIKFSDDIEFSAESVNAEYKMSIYPGLLNQDGVTATLTIGGETYVLNTEVGEGTLKILATVQDDVTGGGVSAEASEGTKYYVNDSEVEVAPERVQLLVDDVTNDAEDAQAMADSAISAVTAHLGSELENAAYAMNYLDLVDASNGNTKINFEGEMTVSWPVPEDAAEDSEFHVVHYYNMDRSDADADLENYTVIEAEAVDGNVTFTTDSFSPFVLVYEAKDGETTVTEPSYDDLWSLFRGNIKVQCVNEDADHHSETGTFNLYANGATTYYSVEASETVEGAFDVTIYGEGYLEEYQNLTLVTYFDVPEHSFVDGVDSITVTVVYDEEEQAWTCDALPITFEVVCESATEPVDPGEPGYEELWDLFRDGIKVECVNGEAEHYGETGTYGLFNNTATETYFSVEKGETAGAYEVTIYGEEYLEDYETETLTGYDDVPEHSFVDDVDSITVTVVYDPANAKWTCEALPITFEVVCENPVEPPVPGHGITGFAKSLVTDRSVYRANRIAYPEFGRGGVIVDEGDSVTLIYRITVKGVAGTEYTVSDPGAKLLSGSWTGTLDEDGSDTLLVAKTFSWYYARHNDFLVNSASVSVDGHTAASATRRVYFDIDWDYNPPKDDDDEKEDDDTVYVPNYLNTSDHDAYIVGYEDGTIRPNSNITRAEVATIFYRLLTKSAHERWDTTSNSFTDVAEDSWYNDAVSTLSRMGIVNGYADGSFKPDAQISRAEFTAIATRFFSHTADYKGAFNDVAASSWYADYVQAAVDMNLVDGYPDGGFHPDSSITRAEAVTIVNRVLGRAPHEDHLLSTGVMNTWSDNLPGAWYYADMQEATNSHNYSWVQIRGERVEDWTAKTADPNW